MHLVLRSLGIKVDGRKALEVVRRIEVKIRQFGLEIIEDVRVGPFFEQRPVIVGLKPLLDVVGLVDKIQDESLFLAGMHTVEP